MALKAALKNPLTLLLLIHILNSSPLYFPSTLVINTLKFPLIHHSIKNNKLQTIISSGYLCITIRADTVPRKVPIQHNLLNSTPKAWLLRGLCIRPTCCLFITKSFTEYVPQMPQMPQRPHTILSHSALFLFKWPTRKTTRILLVSRMHTWISLQKSPLLRHSIFPPFVRWLLVQLK